MSTSRIEVFSVLAFHLQSVHETMVSFQQESMLPLFQREIFPAGAIMIHDL